MPVIIDGEAYRLPLAGGACGWDVNAAETLFWESVPIRMKLGGQDDRIRLLSLRILLWDNSARRVPKTLGIVVTSDENHFFLYTLEVNEEDFATLRHDQGILVDFGSFPSEMISLLRCCIASGSDGTPKFQAVLETIGGTAKFNVIETNKFKHLTHISLIFQLGTDTTIKQYLSSRLQEVCKQAAGLETDKAELQLRVAQLENTVAELKEFQVHGRQTQERTLNEVSSKYEKQLVEERNARLRDLTEANDKAMRDLADAAQRHNVERDNLQRRVSELEEENTSLRDQKYNLDTKVSRLSAELGTSTGELSAIKIELQRLRDANLKLSNEKHELERRLNDAHVDLASLRSQVSDKESLNMSNKGRLAELEKANSMLESSLEESRQQHKAAEARFMEQKAETQKSIQIIERFQNEVAACKSKIKAYKSMIQNQESQKHSAEEERDRLQSNLEGLKHELEAKKRDLELSQKTIEDQKSKLMEAHQQIDSNRKFISYLNSQCNQAQIGAVSSSRYIPLQTSNRPNVGALSPVSTSQYLQGRAPSDVPLYKPYTSYGANSTNSND